ncbi:hypothetical protein [Pontixanthobacter sp. CEM42]|uniref:hypothetical protein n=1 Tax=Pontixanthobacter sp. CEM42 TaxID=2792077 RepID=UPI001ADF0CA9|nr:hypothetical protein [Pontixanthobacter sp. CEM42]
MRKYLFGVATAALIAMPLQAQDAETQEQSEPAQMPTAASEVVEAVEVVRTPVVAKPAGPLTLAAGRPLTLVVTDEVNSSTHDAGDIFELTVKDDVVIDNKVVIPAGTPASAEITWRTGKGAFGKSGKLEFGLRSVNLGGAEIPIKGDFRQEGEGNTVATGVGVLAIGVFAGFITGKRARLPTGRELAAQIAQPVEFTADGSLSSNFDSQRAMDETFGNTPLAMCKAEANTIEKTSRREKALKKCFKKRME